MINNKYEILDTINSGNYGKVYKVKYNNNFYALKEEISNNIILHNEANIYKELRFVKTKSLIERVILCCFTSYGRIRF